MEPEVNQTIQETVHHEENANRDDYNIPYIKEFNLAEDLPWIIHEVLTLIKNFKNSLIKKLIK